MGLEKSGSYCRHKQAYRYPLIPAVRCKCCGIIIKSSPKRLFCKVCKEK